VIDGWAPRIASSLVVLTLVAAFCLAIGTQQFRKRTGERVQS
jgi:hypothetical protein